MDFRKFLGKEEQLVFPYVGGSTVEGHGRLLRVKERPAQRGWYRFRVVGRNAFPIEKIDAPGELMAQTARGHHFGGYLFAGDGLVDELQLCDGEPDAFAPCKAYRWGNGELIFASSEFEGEAEGQVREALEELRPLTTIKGVPATLRQAYGFAVLARRARQLGTHVAPIEVSGRLSSVAEIGLPMANEVLARLIVERNAAAARVRAAQAPAAPAAAPPPAPAPVSVPAPPPRLDPVAEARLQRRLAESEQRENQRVHQDRVEDAVRQAQRGRRGHAPHATQANAAERAEDALEAAGARPTATRRVDDGRLEVRYRFMNQSFITVVHPLTLQVLDAGICLAGADRMVTLDSLPSVIREAINTSKLVITRR